MRNLFDIQYTYPLIHEIATKKSASSHITFISYTHAVTSRKFLRSNRDANAIKKGSEIMM